MQKNKYNKKSIKKSTKTKHGNNNRNNNNNRNKTKSKSKTRARIQNHSGGGTQVGLDVYYLDNKTNIANQKIIYNNTENDFTPEYDNGNPNSILINEPITTVIQPIENIRYMIVMYDPDAPNGINSTEKHIYTHWIFTQIGNDITTRNTILPYRPPSHPKGIHRYIFALYKANAISNTEIEGLIASNSETVLPKAPSLLPYKVEYKIDSGK